MDTIEGDPRVRKGPALHDTNFLALKYSDKTGYGLFASRAIPEGTTVLTSAGPELHVVYREFRKEVCAWCFRYDRGKTWHVRFEAEAGAENRGVSGMVFCCETCRDSWVAEYGALGLEAYTAVEELIRRQSRNKGWASNDNGDLDAIEREPTGQEIEDAWIGVERDAELIRAYRLQNAIPNNGTQKATEKLMTSTSIAASERRTTRKIQKQALDGALKLQIGSTDTMFFLLSGVLCRSSAATWSELLLLSPSQPYTSVALLRQTTSSYLQLLAVLPPTLLAADILSRPILEAILSRDRANSFGLWSTTPETDAEDPEMLGYGTWAGSSFFNHSCDPNLKKRREGRNWIFVARRNIAEGEECYISYIRGEEDVLNVEARRKRLLDGWGFMCGCQKCVGAS